MAREYPKSVKGWGEAERKYDTFARLNQLNIKHPKGYNSDGDQEDYRRWAKDWLEKNCDLSDSQYKEALPVRYCQLPKTDPDGSFAREACMISEREVWWNLDNLAEGGEMQERKSQNRNWLEKQRKQVWADAEGSQPDKTQPQPNPDHKPYGWDQKNREQRYEYLCIATKHGSAWEDWKKKHNTTTGEEKKSTSNTRHRLSEHFIVEEFDCNDGTKVASREHNGLEYLCETFLEPLRDAYGTVTINSGFRTHAYNASIGGASGSFHVYNEHDGNDQAADITCAKGTPSQWHSKLNSIRASQRGGNGGLGLYSTFVHVDTRDYPSNWTG